MNPRAAATACLSTCFLVGDYPPRCRRPGFEELPTGALVVPNRLQDGLAGVVETLAQTAETPQKTDFKDNHGNERNVCLTEIMRGHVLFSFYISYLLVSHSNVREVRNFEYAKERLRCTINICRNSMTGVQIDLQRAYIEQVFFYHGRLAYYLVCSVL